MTGQGAFEGDGEISFHVVADPLTDPTLPAVVEFVGTQDYGVEEVKGHTIGLGTYEVAAGTVEEVRVCVNFREHDNGGLNGGDDTGAACTVIPLVCSAADANGDGRADGSRRRDDWVASNQLCGDNQCNGSVAAMFETMAEDADNDNVVNAKDVTPDVCDEELKGTEGIGALVYYQFGDSGMTSLFQAIGVNLAQIYPHYDYVVLVADQQASNPMHVKAAAFSGANKVFPPTREGLLDGVQELTSRGLRFDTFVFSHGTEAGVANDSSFETITGDPITGDFLLASLGDSFESGTEVGGIPIVAWWSTTCFAARQVDVWMAIGALTTSGSIDTYFYPNSWGLFFSDWVGGDQYKIAVDTSTPWSVVTAAEMLMDSQSQMPPFLCQYDDPSTPQPGDPSGLATGLNGCAVAFFTGNDSLHPILDYEQDLSGAENMARSSVRVFLGDGTITFGAPLRQGSAWP